MVLFDRTQKASERERGEDSLETKRGKLNFEQQQAVRVIEDGYYEQHPFTASTTRNLSALYVEDEILTMMPL